MIIFQQVHGMQREKQNKIILVPLVSTDGTHAKPIKKERKINK